MADTTKILDLIPESLHEELFKEVQEKLKNQQSQKAVDTDMVAYAKKQNAEALKSQAIRNEIKQHAETKKKNQF